MILLLLVFSLLHFYRSSFDVSKPNAALAYRLFSTRAVGSSAINTQLTVYVIFRLLLSHHKRNQSISLRWPHQYHLKPIALAFWFEKKKVSRYFVFFFFHFVTERTSSYNLINFWWQRSERRMTFTTNKVNIYYKFTSQDNISYALTD